MSIASGAQNQTPRAMSPDTVKALETYIELLKKWTRRINLVSKNSLGALWERHILDSVQVFDTAKVRDGYWLDLGSGGGLPGVVVAILAANEAPGLRIACVESDQRKAAFLRTVSRETSVPFKVLDQRIEQLTPQGADVVSARALASLDTLLGHAERHLNAGGEAIFSKGEGHDIEFFAAKASWDFESETIPSTTNPGSVLYKIKGVRRV